MTLGVTLTSANALRFPSFSSQFNSDPSVIL